VFDTIAAAEIWRFPAWIAVLSATIVFLEAKRLFLLRHFRPAKEFAAGFATGVVPRATQSANEQVAKILSQSKNV